MTDRLTLKQKLFVEAYLGQARGNATEAARQAGYKGDDNTLGQVGAENLKNPKIASHVRERVEEAAMSADEVLKELSDIARSDWRDHLKITRDKHGNVIDAVLLLRDKVRSLELLGKYHKLFTDHIDMTTNGQPLTFAALVQTANDERKDSDSDGVG